MMPRCSAKQAYRLVEWYLCAPLDEVWAELDKVLYMYKPRYLADELGVSIDVVYSWRKQCVRSKARPKLEHGIKMLSMRP